MNGRNYSHRRYNTAIISNMRQMCFDNKNVNDLLTKCFSHLRNNTDWTHTIVQTSLSLFWAMCL